MLRLRQRFAGPGLGILHPDLIDLCPDTQKWIVFFLFLCFWRSKVPATLPGHIKTDVDADCGWTILPPNPGYSSAGLNLNSAMVTLRAYAEYLLEP